MHLWKLLVGHHFLIASWSGPKSPNSSHHPAEVFEDCGVPPTGAGCLYDLTDDPGEHHNLMSTGSLDFYTKNERMRFQSIRDVLFQKIQRHNATAFSPDRGTEDKKGACGAARTNGYFWGPWLD